MPRKRTLLSVTAATLLAYAAFGILPVSATTFCTIKKTSDGFVALRAGPGVTTRLIARMKANDEVMVGLKEKGNWMEVTWWRGEDRHASIRRGFKRRAGRCAGSLRADIRSGS